MAEDKKEEHLTPEQIKAKKKQENKDTIEGCGCFILIAVIVILGVVFLIRGCNRNSDDSSSSDAKTEQTSSSSDDDSDNNDADDDTDEDDDSSDNKETDEQIKDAQKAMTTDLSNDRELAPFITRIKYQGDSNAQITVNDDFTALSNSEKTEVAKMVNNLVISDLENKDNEPAFLTFVKRNLTVVGRSKYFDKSEYKWK